MNGSWARSARATRSFWHGDVFQGVRPLVPLVAAGGPPPRAPAPGTQEADVQGAVDESRDLSGGEQLSAQVQLEVGQLGAQHTAQSGSSSYVAEPVKPIVTRPPARRGSAGPLRRQRRRREDRPGPLEVPLTRGCQFHPPSSIGSALDPEVGYQPLDLLRQRRLRDVQALCCSAEAALLGDCDEVAQMSQLHGANLPPPPPWALAHGGGRGCVVAPPPARRPSTPTSRHAVPNDRDQCGAWT